MGSASAAPLQPLVAGLVTFAGGVWGFSGKGCLPIVGHPAAGAFLLAFDPGELGLTGAVQAITVPVRGFPPDPTLDPDVRSIVTVRGPFPSLIFNISARYIAGAPGVGAPVMSVMLASNANVLIDPPATGFDVIVWKGLGGDRAGPQLTFP